MSKKPTHLPRRDFLKLAGGAAIGTAGPAFRLHAAKSDLGKLGYVVGEATGDKVGMMVLADGGNAMDAIVAAALTAAVAAPASTGIGGYGMSAVIATAGGKRIVAIDGNSTAPAAMRADTFRPGPDGKLPDGFSSSNWLSSTGWLSAGCPVFLPVYNSSSISSELAAFVNWFSPQ